MRKILTAGVAALTLVGSLAASATPAAAQHYRRHGDYRHHGDNDTGAAIAGGILGFALGAAVGSSGHNHYYNRYYGRPYYGAYYGRSYYGGSYYGRPYYGRPYYAYATCVGHREVWDPYIGGYVMQRFTYAC